MNTLRTVIRVTVFALLTIPVAGPCIRLASAQQQSPSPPSELRDTIELFSTDRAALLRRYGIPYSVARRARLRQFYTDWVQRLGRVSADGLGIEGRVDRVLFANELRYQLALLDREER